VGISGHLSRKLKIALARRDFLIRVSAVLFLLAGIFFQPRAQTSSSISTIASHFSQGFTASDQVKLKEYFNKLIDITFLDEADFFISDSPSGNSYPLLFVSEFLRNLDTYLNDFIIQTNLKPRISKEIWKDFIFNKIKYDRIWQCTITSVVNEIGDQVYYPCRDILYAFNELPQSLQAQWTKYSAEEKWEFVPLDRVADMRSIYDALKDSLETEMNWNNPFNSSVMSPLPKPIQTQIFRKKTLGEDFINLVVASNKRGQQPQLPTIEDFCKYFFPTATIFNSNTLSYLLDNYCSDGDCSRTNLIYRPYEIDP
jgi:hypothetical protein